MLISGNCQRYAIAAQLSLWFPAWNIRTLDVSSLRPGASFPQLLENVSLWVSIGDQQALQEERLCQIRNPLLKRLNVPELGFAAFHPDICFVKDRHSGFRPMQVFHSAIVAWAYRNHYSIEETAQLFNAAAFKALGYFDAWKDSVNYLRQAFQVSELANDFEDFFFFVKRQGCFMHTFNHPKAFAVAKLCRLLCKKLSIQPLANLDLQEEATSLSATRWPIYPEIASHLGVGNGDYCWVFNHQPVNGLAQFVEQAFEDYRQIGITPENLELVNRDLALFDRVLNQPRG